VEAGDFKARQRVEEVIEKLNVLFFLLEDYRVRVGWGLATLTEDAPAVDPFAPAQNAAQAEEDFGLFGCGNFPQGFHGFAVTPDFGNNERLHYPVPPLFVFLQTIRATCPVSEDASAAFPFEADLNLAVGVNKDGHGILARKAEDIVPPFGVVVYDALFKVDAPLS
jgi:hypothetical protein